MKLKRKILLGYSLSLALVVIVGGLGINNLRRLSKASEAILQENYQSILASENTIEALERQDSAILLFLLENRDRGRQQFRQNQIQFLKWLGKAESNIRVIASKNEFKRCQNEREVEVGKFGNLAFKELRKNLTL